jgi:hypothetical protein
MKRKIAERNLVVVLFVFVIVLFSFAQNDTQKLKKELYTSTERAIQKIAFLKDLLPGK